MNKLKSVQSLPLDAVYDELESPVGVLILIASQKGLHCVLWEHYREHAACQKILNRLKQSADNNIIIKTKQQLGEYFKGLRKTFDLPLVLEGSDFQIKAWKTLVEIPYATTLSYGEQAAKVGHKNKARAVGMANGMNPISIIIPCHRVIGSNGKLVGFGGGLDTKSKLLKLEKLNHE
ncbi:MAG: methylated-DNA--[protein]-cysteine S-methyltransferase [Legionella sp.]|nr:methylated-DNA--[protein]-cysteine S-methyltransferase [Legionella sp.]